jgi:hypothetical protein
MDDAGHVSVLAYPGPGCSPNEPMALVAVFSDILQLPPPDNVMPPQASVDEGPIPFEPQYSKHPQLERLYCMLIMSLHRHFHLVHYQVYKKHGAVVLKQPADPSDPYVGRLNVNSIPPPPHCQISNATYIKN